MDNKTIWLQKAEYDKNDNCMITDFEVDKKWLENNIEESIEEFLDEYTSDECIPLYRKAILDNAILSEATMK